MSTREMASQAQICPFQSAAQVKEASVHKFAGVTKEIFVLEVF